MGNKSQLVPVPPPIPLTPSMKFIESHLRYTHIDKPYPI